jgi:putative RNA 2'-phosphotransferase
MNLTQVSKYMSLILRHKPEEIGITLDEHGWADVHDLIRGVKKKYSDFGMYELIQIVDTDEKQRYSFNDDCALIRANQGHSIKVDVELKECEPPMLLYHGTARKYMESIDKNGLVPKTRLYVHLSKDVETAYKVGLRHAKRDDDVVIYRVRALAMWNKGYKFYLSENGVWLTDSVPVGYLVKEDVE